MKKLTAWLTWIDNNILKVLIVGLIFIIPLYPKIPLRLIEYTYIAVRLDDVYIGFITFIFFLQLLRRKITLNKKFVILFIAFWAAAFVSFLLGYYFHHTIRQQLFQVGLLHTLRRIEYMIVFFIAMASVNSKKDLMFYLKSMFIVMFLVVVYGIGQKFLGWPAVQTMNPAFARGMLLYLTPEARISSTFAGHYDLAAYLIIMLPLVLSMYFTKKNPLYYGLFILGAFALMLTASRTSYIAYLVSVLSYLIYLRRWKHLIFVTVLSVCLTFLSQNLTSRWFQTLQIKQVFVNEQTGRVVMPQRMRSDELPAGSLYVPIDDGKDGKDNTPNPQVTVNPETQRLVRAEILEQIRQEASRSGRILTATEEAKMVATISSGLKPIQTVAPDISMATRFQVEWPRAIRAFKKDPLFGTGPSSITEATDNDYLRWLGEFGLVGTSIFLFIIGVIMKYIWDAQRQMKDHTKEVYIGVLFGIFGLLINAGYIDVFEASKVAYHFWALVGIFMGTLHINKLLPDDK